MNSGAGSKKLLVVGALVVVALLLAGLVTGAIGAAFLKSDGEPEGLIPKPVVHLAPQPVFPADAREHFLEFEEGYANTPFEKPLWPPVLTNTILSSWLTTLVLVSLFAVGTARTRLVPRGLQNLLEMVVEALLGFIESVAGKERGRSFVPVIATIFLFVAFNAWMGLLPFYPALGWVRGNHLEAHLLRPAGTDLNMPLALALVSFAFVQYCGVRALGAHYVNKFIRVGSLKQGMRDLVRGRPTGAIQGLLEFFFVGPLEAFSELVRILSFTFRLFGNMTAGEILVLVFTFLISFVATVLVYGLEILVGFVQALIFAGLTLVFATLAVTAHGEEGHQEQNHGG